MTRRATIIVGALAGVAAVLAVGFVALVILAQLLTVMISLP